MGNNPIRYVDPDGNSFIEKLKAIPYFIAGTMVGLGTLVEDGATGGVGLADDPASLALAGGLYALGMAHWTKTDDTSSFAGNGPTSLGLKLQNKAQTGSSGALQPNPNNDEKPEFDNARKTAEKFNTNEKNYERNVKKKILQDAKNGTSKEVRDFLRSNSNPDIGSDKSGNLWLRSCTTGDVVKTDLSINWYVEP